VIRRDHATGLYAAHCDGALSCNARSKPSPKNWATSMAKRAGWHVSPGLFPGDSKPANMGVTICPACVERMKLGTLHTVDTGSDDRGATTGRRRQRQRRLRQKTSCRT